MRRFDVTIDETRTEMSVASVHGRLVRRVALVSGALHCAATPLYYVAAAEPAVPVLVVVPLMGAVHAVAAMTESRWGSALLRYFLIPSVCMEVALLLAYEAWAPGVVLSALLATVAGGLVHGRLGSLAAPLTLAAGLLFGGYAVERGWASYPSLSVQGPWVWLSAAGSFALLTTVAAFAFDRLLGELARTHELIESNLKRLEQEGRAAEEVRGRRAAVESEVYEAQKLHTVAQLATGIAHVMNDALTVVRGGIEVMRQGGVLSARRELGARLTESVMAAATMMRDLLVFSRLGGQDAEPLSLASELPAALGVLRGVVPERIDLQTEIAEVPLVVLPRARMRQVLLNLVLNARDAVAASGTIRLRTGGEYVLDGGSVDTQPQLAPGRYVTLTVEDDGAGMAPEVRARACAPFFTTRADTHHGLGLFAVYGLARSWGGGVEIDSEEGRGTSVTVYIPAVSDHQLRAALDEDDSPTLEVLESILPSRNAAPALPEQWRRESAQPVLVASVIVPLVAIMSRLAFQTRVEPFFVVTSALVAVLAAVLWRMERWSIAYRFAALVIWATVLAAAGFVLEGIMAAPAVTALATTVILAVIFVGRVGGLIVGVLAMSAFVVGAVAPFSGSAWANVDAASPQTWMRLGILLPVEMIIAATLVLRLYEVARRSLLELEELLTELISARREHRSVRHSLTEVEVVAEETAPLASLGQAAGTVAHDLNNALAGIAGWASLLEHVPAEHLGDASEILDGLDESVSHAEELMVRLERTIPEAASRSAPIDLAATVERFRSVLDRLTQSHVVVALDLSADCWVALEANDLRRVLINLASNARDAMPKGGTLTIRCRAVDEGVELEVTDTGVGIDTAALERIFDPFFTTKPAGHGTGLGLVAVDDIVRQSGGVITVRSEPGTGTTFRVRWPHARPPPKVSEAPTPRVESGSGVILLVEDNEPVRDILARGLEGLGFHVVTARDGSEGLEVLAERDDWDALCTDAVMPGAPVPDLIAEFQRRFAGRPVIVFSGYVPEELVGITATPGVVLRRKPIGPFDLAEELTSRLEARRSTQPPA